MNKKISIIVPVYKSEKWLPRCIESIREQTYSNLEIILVNDGSPDESGKICDEYSKEDGRIIVIHKKNAGASEARNDGLKVSTGDYIQFVDSDDWIEKNMCELLIKNIEETNSDLAICGLKVFKDNILLRRPHLSYKKLSIKESIKNYLYIHPVFSSPCNKLYKKSKIVSSFNSNISLGEDLMFNLGYLKNIENIIVIENCLYNVCLDNSNSLNRKFREDRLDIVIKLVNNELDFCNEIYGKSSDKTEIYNLYILGIHAYFRDLILKKHKNKRELYIILNKYLNDTTINNASKITRMNRLDYRVFNTLIKMKNKSLIYYFFKLKNLKRIG